MRKIIPLLAVLILAGCANLAYNTLYSTGHAVDVGFTTYLDLVAKHQVRTNGVPVIAKEYNTFQIAFGEAVAIARVAKNQTPPTNVTVQAAQVLAAIAIEKGAR